MNVYLRDNGPICFEARVFFDPALRVKLPDELLMSGLAWCWESIRRDKSEIIPSSALPPERKVTVLTKENTAAFLADLQERDADGYGRWIALFGAQPHNIDTLLDGPVGPKFQMALSKFLTHEAEPIQIVVVQVSDTNHEYVFVPSQPIGIVDDLLTKWGAGASTPLKSRPYKSLYLAQLETIYQLRP